MKNTIVILFLFFAFSFSFAQVSEHETDKARIERATRQKAHIDSLNQTLGWKEIRDGLYVNKKGDIGFQVVRLITKEASVTDYITEFYKYGALKNIIDIKTFRRIAGENAYGGYYKDKKRIYHYFGNTSGGSFSVVEEADYPTFTIIAECYAIDKRYVYDLRFGLMDEADRKTFKVIYYNNRCYAKDKNGYYHDNTKLSDELLDDSDFLKAKAKLDKM